MKGLDLYLAEVWHKQMGNAELREYDNLARYGADQMIGYVDWEPHYWSKVAAIYENFELTKEGNVTEQLTFLSRTISTQYMLMEKYPNVPWHAAQLSKTLLRLHHFQKDLSTKDQDSLAVLLREQGIDSLEDETLRLSLQAAKIDFNNPMFYKIHAQNLLVLQRYDEAIEYYQKVLSLDPLILDVYIPILKHYFYQDEYDKSLEYATRLSDQAKAQLLYKEFELNTPEGRLKKELIQADIQELKRYSVESLSIQAQILIKQQKINEAFQSLLQLNQIAPDHDPSMLVLTNFLVRLKRWEQLTTQFDSRIPIQLSHPQILENVLKAHQALGQSQHSRDLLNRYHRQYPSTDLSTLKAQYQ